MKIKSGGQTDTLKGKIKTIRIESSNNERTFEVWINEDCLSYFSINELLDLNQEIKKALQSLIN